MATGIAGFAVAMQYSHMTLHFTITWLCDQNVSPNTHTNIQKHKIINIHKLYQFFNLCTHFVFQFKMLLAIQYARRVLSISLDISCWLLFFLQCINHLSRQLLGIETELKADTHKIPIVLLSSVNL